MANSGQMIAGLEAIWANLRAIGPRSSAMTNGPTKVVADMLDAGTKMSKQMFRPTIPIDTGNWQE